MKKMFIALDEEKIIMQMKKTGKYYIFDKKITYKEGVLEFLSKNDVDILITKDSLEGDMTKEIYAKQIKLISEKTKVIFFVEILDEKYKHFLFLNGIFNIIEDKEITFRTLFDLIESDKYELIQKEPLKIDKKEVDGLGVITKQIISVFGTSGSGKSYVSSLVSNIISKKYKLETLLIDMDVQNPSTDIYNNINGEINSLYYIMEDIDNESFNENSFRGTISKSNNNKNLYFITNNLDIYECQNRLSSRYYKSLYDLAKQTFDITIIDTPASPFLDAVSFSLISSQKIIFVVNPNFISIRQAIKYLDLMVNVWNISKEKIYIIVNKVSKSSLSERQVSSMFKSYKIIHTLNLEESVEGLINGSNNIQELISKDNDFIKELLDIKNKKERINLSKKWV